MHAKRIFILCPTEAVTTIKVGKSSYPSKIFLLFLWQLLILNRDFELREAREDNLSLSKQLEDVEVS